MCYYCNLYVCFDIGYDQELRACRVNDLKLVSALASAMDDFHNPRVQVSLFSTDVLFV